MLDLTQIAVIAAAIGNENRTKSEICQLVAERLNYFSVYERQIYRTFDDLERNRLLILDGVKLVDGVGPVPTYFLTPEGSRQLKESVSHHQMLVTEIYSATRSVCGVI